jgi:hypothetical protein
LDLGNYARLNPNENIITEPIKLQVPESAPYKVIIEASIENTYYHYGKPEQVIAPGMTQSLETTISETSYRAFASPEYTFYPSAQPVIISGQAISNTPSPLGGEGGGEGLPVPNVPVKLCISVKGFDRCYTVTTSSDGTFTYTFTPGSNEAGVYSLWAVHPDVTTRAVQSTFTIAGLQISPEIMNIRMVKNRTIDISLKLSNIGEIALTNLQFLTETSPGITAGVIPSNPPLEKGGEGGFESGLSPTLAAGGTLDITLKISASDSASDRGYVTLFVSASNSELGTLNSELVTARFDASLSLVQTIPIIDTKPSYIDTGMVRGDQKLVTFTITNTGEETLKNARLEGPSTPWMILAVNPTIAEIKPGASTDISIILKPPADLPQAIYDDRIVIYSDNHIPYTYHIQVTVTSNAVGNVLFDVLNEFMEDVPDATITFQHQLLTELIYKVTTGADGTVMQYDIPEGKYTYIVSPPAGHIPTSGTFAISPGQTTLVPIALQLKLVEITWSVEEIVIEDRYEIKVAATFETHVPAPVIITEPPSITLPDMQPGQVLNGEFKVTNYGLIAVDNVKLNFPTSFMDYDIEVFTSAIPKRLEAMKSTTVPYRITKRQLSAISYQPPALGSQYACNFSLPTSDFSLFEEVQGYGGSGCYTSFPIGTCGDYVCCPNTPQQTMCGTCTYHTVAVPIGCGSGGGSGGGGVYSYGHVPCYGDCTPSSGSGIPQPPPATLPTGNCECINCDDKNPCTDDSCKDGICEHKPKDCDDGDPCTTDSCVDGGCVNTPINCDDGDECTDDLCEDGVCVNKPKDCDDGDQCTLDYCDENGNCANIPIDCDDGDPCTSDRCDYGTCIHESKCDDGDPCTIDSCDENGNCTNTPIDCDDGNECTEDSCVDGSCIHKSKCDDGDPCTWDSCNPELGCKNIPKDCDDKNPCTDDFCDATGTCVHKFKCDDGRKCTEDTCDIITGNCYNRWKPTKRECLNDFEDCIKDILLDTSCEKMVLENAAKYGTVFCLSVCALAAEVPPCLAACAAAVTGAVGAGFQICDVLNAIEGAKCIADGINCMLDSCEP